MFGKTKKLKAEIAFLKGKLDMRLEGVDDLAVVLLFGAVLGHHGLPEQFDAFVAFGGLVFFRVFDLAWSGDDDFTANLAELVEESLEDESLLFA